MILKLLLRGLVADFHCLLGAEVDTGQALGAVRANLSFLVNDGDVAIGAHPGADAAAYTFVPIHILLDCCRCYRKEQFAIDSCTGKRSASVFQAMDTAIDFTGNLFQ